MILNASLDTSFWNIASQIGVVPYLFSYFCVYYCEAVEREIVTTDPGKTPLVYPQAMLFMVMKQDGRLHPQEPDKPLSLFGVGEAHAMALAHERSWVLLINDARPLAFAQTLHIPCVSVPDFCVLLYAQGKVTHAAVQGYMKRLATSTSPAIIQQAQTVVTLLAQDKGKAV